MTILTTLYIILAVMLLFGAAIFFHELGHYWVALKLGLKVEEFAIGMGPKMFSWKRNGIVYSVRWIPAGGFVKLPQMITSEALEGKAEGEVPPVAPWKKILVAVAGPLMNVLFAFVIATFIHFVGLPIAVNPPVVGYVKPNSPEAEMGIRPGDTIVSVNGERIKSWDDINIITATARTSVMPVVIERDGKKQTYTLTATPNEVVGLKLLNLDPKDHPQIMGVQSDSPALAAGLKTNDVIISFAGAPVASVNQLIGLIHKCGGKTTDIVVQRGSENLTLKITPSGAEPDSGRIGAELGSSAIMVYVVQRPGPKPLEQISDVVDKTFKTISALIHSKQTGIGPKDLSGPVGILAMLGAWVKTDYRLALSFLVLLNINLAIINLLPIPVLDGGHIMMSIIEKIRRRPLSPKIVEYVTTGFALLLISFMLYVTFFDIRRIPAIRTMFQNKIQIQEPQNGTPDPAPAPAPAAPR
jgi:regulator of sigma E protease